LTTWKIQIRRYYLSALAKARIGDAYSFKTNNQKHWKIHTSAEVNKK
jgi:hypothetical protein